MAMVPSAIATASCGHVQLEASWRRTSDKGSQAQEETPPLTSDSALARGGLIIVMVNWSPDS